MTSLLSLMPNELIAKISEYTDSKTKREFSMVDRRINAVVLNTVKCIRIFLPKCPTFQKHSSNMPEDILVRVIRRYPTLEKIILGPKKNGRMSSLFNAKEEVYLKSLISYLESDLKKHPLGSVKKIQYKEISLEKFNDFDDEEELKELNTRILSAIGHNGLENIRIGVKSILTGTEVNPMLKNSPNLKTFVFDGFLSEQTVALCFANQPKLSKVKLLNWGGSASTIDSLKNCKELEELVICQNEFTKIKAIFLRDHSWNLKRLELKGIALLNDAVLDTITKKLPNLECLDVELWCISDKGMELLGQNCPNLKILRFSNEYLTNSGLDRLTRYLPQLEIISFSEAHNITENGITAIAQNCKNLRFIKVTHYKKIKKSGIDALAENCRQLRVIEFSAGGPISLKGMYHLGEQIPKLHYVKLCNIAGVKDNQIKEFYQKFPQFISRIPYLSSVKKLQGLTI